MKRWLNSLTVTTGLAIFSMLFGAGNLMYPINIGLQAGSKNIFAFIGFVLTAVLLPLIGLITIIFFDGNYKEFFNRMGKPIGSLLILFCMLVIGPLIAMPRIVTLSYTMISPFLPGVSVLVFSIAFVVLTFLGTYRENKIIDLLGRFVSPLLLICLGIIIFIGLFTTGTITTVNTSATKIFLKNLKYGFNTLDLLGTIFFGTIILQILKSNKNQESDANAKKIALLSLKAGTIGTCLLGIVYLGMSYLGVMHGHGLSNINEGEIFSAISFRILGSHGAFIIATTVLMACFSTIIALAAVVSEYLQKTIFRNRIGFIPCLALILGATVIPSNYGLSKILEVSGPIINIFYPIITAITFCNLAYKLFNFKPIKIPVLLTFLVAIVTRFI